MVPATQRTCKTNNDYSTVTCSFEHTETILKEALQNLGEYYERNHLRSNPDKTQTCEFHLKNREANRKLNITWYNKHLEHIPNPVYLRVTLDRTLSYKEHIHKLKCKISVRNNILRMLSNTKWGAKPATIKTTYLAPGYSMAECACPVWKRSTQDSVFGQSAVAPYRMAGSAPHKSGLRRVKSWSNHTHKQTHSSHMKL